MNAKDVSTAFADLDNSSLPDEQFVTFCNATMPQGLLLMQAECLSASRDRKEVIISFDLAVHCDE